MLTVLVCAGCNARTEPRGAPQWQGFPVLPPVPDADPSVRHPEVIQVPTKLAIERTAEYISIAIDRDSAEPAEIMVGYRMLTGVRRELYVYRVGEPRKSFSSGLGGFYGGTDFVRPQLNGMPVPGEKYVVEMDLALFETDIPAQHFWSPESGKYKVLWTRTLRQIVE